MDAVPSMLEYIVRGAASAVLPMNLLVMFLGLIVGIVGGMLPGITTVTAVALFVPFTFSMPPDMALIGLGGVFCGAMYGGANAAILINTPGTPHAAATMLDGYPLSKMGRTKAALKLARYASTIGDLAKAVQQLVGDTGTNIIGTRHGEKLFETLMTREERLRSEDMGGYYRVAADNRDLNYDKFVVKGEVHTMADDSYTSHNTHRLDVEGTVRKILTTEYVQNALKEMEAEKA